MARWRCRISGCPRAVWQRVAPAGVRARAESAAQLEQHWREDHAGEGAVRVVAAPVLPVRGDEGRRDPVRLVGRSDALALVLEPGRLLNPFGGSLEVSRPAHVGALVDVVTEGVGVIFVTAAAAAWLWPQPLGPVTGAGGYLEWPFCRDAEAAGWVVDGSTWLLRVRRSATSPPVSVVLCPYDVDGYAAPWSTLDGPDLVEALRAFRDAVGMSPAASLGATGERLLLALHNRAKGGARLDPSPVMPAPLLEGAVREIGSTWRRSGSVGEPGWWVHWYDANANYLGAYQTAELGRGEPESCSRPAELLDERYPPPGLWRVRLPALEPSLPAPWSLEAEWHTTPTVVRAREVLGEPLEVVEAIVWPVRSRFCEPFGSAMRDARARLLADVDAGRPGAGPALSAVTGIYQRLHGRFGAGFRAGTASPWWRPDWMHTIRAQARVNLDRRVRRLSVRPFAVDVDAVYYATSVEDPAAFAELVGLPIGPRSKLGAFRHAGSVLLTGELLEQLEQVGTAAATRELLTPAAAGVSASSLAMVRAATAVADQAVAALEDVDEDGDGLDVLAEALRELD